MKKEAIFPETKKVKIRNILGYSIMKSEYLNELQALFVAYQKNKKILRHYIECKGKPIQCLSHDHTSIVNIVDKCNEINEKKKVLVLGWYGANNFGDDLMLHIIAHDKSYAYYDVSIIIDPYYSKFIEIEDGISYCYPPSELKDLEKISNYFDLILVAGGGHIDDVEISSLSFIPYLAVELSILAINKKKEVRWKAVSSNDKITNPVYIDKIKYIIENAEEFTVRDNLSAEILKKIGVSKKIPIVDDLALGYAFNKKLLIVTLVPFLEKEVYINILSEIANFQYKSNYSWDVCLLPFYNGNNYDVLFFKELLACMDFNRERFFIGPSYNTIESMIYFMKSADIFFNMRYHASLISLKLGKPTLSFCVDSHRHYFNKISYLNNLFERHAIVYESKYKDGDIIDNLNSIVKNGFLVK